MTKESFIKRIPAVAVSLVVIVGATAASGEGPDFPAQEFEARLETAQWLVRYDKAAWKSTDALLTFPEQEREKLGSQWYCTETGRTWDCYYGKYDAAADRYDVAFRFQSVDGSQFVRIATLPPAEEVTPFARALHRSAELTPELVLRSGLSFNRYVRRTAAGQIETWFLPAWQPDHTLVHGGEVCHTLDATGAKVLETKLVGSRLRTGKPDAGVDLKIDNEDSDIVSIGDLFFILSYSAEFKSVMVRCRKFSTTLIQVKGCSSWLHVERE